MSSQNPHSPAFPSPPLLRPGDVVDGRYRVETVLGSGGMASVYRATHVGLDQPVAIKVVRPHIREVPGVVPRFLREARAATQLKGEHIVRVFDVGTTEGGAPYMVMELLEGRDLDDLLAAEGPLPPPLAVDYILQACEALAEVHGVGIVHRDLKPGNLFLTRGADGLPAIKLIDFGISRIEAPLEDKALLSLTHPEQVMGSPRYMSPEQMESAAKADARSDIWGIGAVLYELLVGRPPYDGESYWDIYVAAKRGLPAAPSEALKDVPKGLDDAVLRCLRAEPDERYADVAELAQALAPFGSKGARDVAESIRRVLDAARTRGAQKAHDSRPSPVVESERSRVRRRVSSPAREADAPPKERATTASFATTLVFAAVAVALLGAGARFMIDRDRAPAAPAPVATSETHPTGHVVVGETLPAPEAAPETAPEADTSATPTPTPTPTPAPTPAPPRARRVGRAIDIPAPAPRPVVTANVAPPPAPPAAPPPNDERKLFEERK